MTLKRMTLTVGQKNAAAVEAVLRHPVFFAGELAQKEKIGAEQRGDSPGGERETGYSMWIGNT